jgi:hypothetical protein
MAALALIAVSLHFAEGALAQCAGSWVSSAGLYGLNGPAYAMVNWDPDGPGPLSAVVAVGGSFTLAGNIPADRIAAWNPGTGQWSAIGTGPGIGNGVYALAVLPNGDLVAGGVPATGLHNSISRWNGTEWRVLGTGMSGGDWSGVFALAVLPNGDLVAGGDFTTAGA